MKQAKKSKTKEKKEIGIRDEIRGLGVLIEHVDSNVSLVAEQYEDIRKTLDNHTEMIGNLTVELEIVKGDVKTTKVDIEIIKADIEFIKNSVKKKIDIDEFAALERRVLILEKHR